MLVAGEVGDAGCCVLVNPPDAGPGGCNPFGGAGAGGLCLSTAECNCDGPDECVAAFFQGIPGTTGSCWPLAGATGCGGGSDLALVADAGLPAHCFPTAALTGSFSMPISADGSDYGTASVTAQLNGVTLYGGQGGAYHDATDPAHPVVVVLIWPGQSRAPSSTRASLASRPSCAVRPRPHASPDAIEVRELGLHGAGRVERGALAYERGEGEGSFWSTTAAGYEEWLLLRPGPHGVTATWEVAGAALRRASASPPLQPAPGS